MFRPNTWPSSENDTPGILSWKWISRSWNEISNYGKGWNPPKKTPMQKSREKPFTGYQLYQRSGLGLVLDAWEWNSSNRVVLDQHLDWSNVSRVLDGYVQCLLLSHLIYFIIQYSLIIRSKRCTLKFKASTKRTVITTFSISSW